MFAINDNVEFRMSYDSEGKLGYWKYTNPVYTLFHEDDKTFSDIWTYYNEDFSIFYADCVKDLETYKDVKGIKAKPNQPLDFIEYIELRFDNDAPLFLYAPEEQMAIQLVIVDIDAKQKELNEQFKGVIQLQTEDARNLAEWRDAINQPLLKTELIKDSTKNYVNDVIYFKFEGHAVEIFPNVEGIGVDIYEEVE